MLTRFAHQLRNLHPCAVQVCVMPPLGERSATIQRSNMHAYADCAVSALPASQKAKINQLQLNSGCLPVSSFV